MYNPPQPSIIYALGAAVGVQAVSFGLTLYPLLVTNPEPGTAILT